MKFRSDPGLGCMRIALLHVGMLAVFTVHAEGGIRTDGSTGPGGLPQVLNGSHVTIPQDLGSTVGKNLFHSFSELNVNTGQTVTFTGDSQLQNVVSRVTGSSRSDINGTLRSTVGNANVYLINPNGVTFGPGAQVDVPAAFHVSTADEIRFKDGARYSATQPNRSSLSASTPESFGFLAKTENNNSLIKIQGATLNTKTGGALDVVANRINLQQSTLNAPAGNIRLVATHGPTRVSLERPADSQALPLPATMPTARSGGRLAINGTEVETQNRGGRIAMWADQMSLSQSIVGHARVSRQILHPTDGITLRAGDLRTTDTKIGTLGSSEASETTPDPGRNANIDIDTTRTLTIDKNTLIVTAAQGTRNGGKIKIRTGDDLRLTHGSLLWSLTQAGHSGGIEVNTAGNLLVDGDNDTNGSQISSFSKGRGTAGNIRLNVAGNMSARNTAFISSLSEASGKAGNVDINVTGRLLLENFARVFSATRPETTGSTGNVTVRVGQDMQLLPGSAIENFVLGSGSPGRIRVEVGNDLTIDNRNSTFSPATIGGESSNTHATGPVDIHVGHDLNIIRGGQINSSTEGAAKAGDIRLDVDGNLLLDGEGTIFKDGRGKPSQVSSRTLPGSTGEGGNVVVHVKGDARIRDSAQISVQSAGSGNAGTIEFGVGGNLLLEGGATLDDSLPTGVFALIDRTGAGKAGSIDLHVGDTLMLQNQSAISIRNFGSFRDTDSDIPPTLSISARDILLKNSFITSDTLGEAAAGNIRINFTDTLDLDPSSISTSTRNGNGGDITITGGQVIRLDRSSITTSVAGTRGNGGDIAIDVPALILDTARVQANTNADGARGGDINLNDTLIIPSSNNLLRGSSEPLAWSADSLGLNIIQAAARAGINGTIQTDAPQLNLSGVLSHLGNPDFDRHALTQDYCALGQGSSLIPVGQGALPPRRSQMLIF